MRVQVCRAKTALLALSLVGLFSLRGGNIPAVPPNFQNEIIIAGLNEPTAIAFTPDGRMLILERGGRIWVVPAGGSAVNPTPFHQIINIGVAGERGLVGVALHPSFATNSYYYVFYTANSPPRDRVSRFTASGDGTIAGSEVVIWQDNVDANNDHHGGCLAFGSDGDLYISTGDHSNVNQSQSLQSYHGKLLRIRPDGTIPSDNPFVDGAGPNLDEIWALGLRNPFRFSIDPVSGRIYIGDVGGNERATSIEEINMGVAGANYGWPICEGTCGTTGMTNPVFSYSHAGRDSATIAGFIYRGSQFPAEYSGTYFYANHVQNWIRRLTLDGSGNVTGSLFFEPNDGTEDGPYGEIVDIKVGPEGAIYYVDYGVSWEGSVNPGYVRRIRYTGTNQPPVISFLADPTAGPAPLTVNFSSAGTYDPEGQPLTYSWNFGDNTTSTMPNPSHVYTQSGRYTARLSVSDGVATSLSAPITINAGSPPTATILTPSQGASFRGGDTINYSGTGTDPESGTLLPGAFSWTVLFHHESHTHPFLGPITGFTSGSFNIPSSGHDFSGNTRYEIILVVADPDGLQNSTSVFINPQKVNLTFNSAPSGLQIALDGANRATPFVLDTLVSFQHTINAVNQTQAGTQYTFLSWSDGGAQSHPINVPSSNQSYTATYSAVVAPPSGLLVGYAMNEGIGTTVADASGNGRTGNIFGATWTTQGRYGNGLSFDGNDRIAGPALPLGSNFTFSAWINNPAYGGYETILSVGSNRDLFTLNGRIGFWTGTIEYFFSSPLTGTGWQHVAVTYNASVLQAYVNGVPYGAPQGATLGAYSGTMEIGSWGGNTDFFSGVMDDVRIYNRVLNQGEIQNDMNTSLSGTPPPDTSPAVRSNGQPSGILPAGTTTATLSLTTNENATCRYSTVAGTAYSSMTDTFTITGALSHSRQVSGLGNGQNYNFYVRCQDMAGNVNTTDFAISFSVANPPPPDTTPPVPSNGQPSGILPAGTTTATLGLTTNENATCRYSTVGGTAYSSMTNTFTITGALSHSSEISGLGNGQSYNFYVRCQDTVGNVDTMDFAISFFVANSPPPDATPPTVSMTAPSDGATVSGPSVTVSANAGDNVGVAGVQFLLDGANLGAEDTIQPYSITWDTTATSNSNHTLSARARDQAGNTATAVSRTITVNNTAPSGLLVAYGLNEGFGNTVSDSSGNGRSATINGATWTPSGRYGGAVSFDGLDDRVTGPSLALSAGFTLMAWVNNPSNQNYETILTIGSARDLYLSSGSITFYDGVDRSFGGAIANNTWQHIAITYDGVNLRAYLNGALRGSPAATGLATTTGVLQLGAWIYGSGISADFFAGTIDEVRIYNRALTQSEIQTQMNTPIIP